MTASTTPADVSEAAEAVARKAHRSSGLQAAARAGFAASGVLQGVIAVLALEVAFHRRPEEADQAGALTAIAQAPGGVVLLGICVAGFLALGLWLGLSAALPRPAAGKRARALHLADGAKALMYLTLAGTGLTVLLRGADDGRKAPRDLSGAVLALPGGAFLLGAVGLATVGVAVYLAHKGVSRRFTSDLALRHDVPEGPVVVLGVVGYLARAVAVGTVGVLVVLAAVTLDPARTTGLDAALRALAAMPFGQVVLTVVAAGWLASALYAFVRAARPSMV
ncbi:MAG: DUF1206 domain-containing protein [Amnibacterium sp.]